MLILDILWTIGSIPFVFVYWVFYLAFTIVYRVILLAALIIFKHTAGPHICKLHCIWGCWYGYHDQIVSTVDVAVRLPIGYLVRRELETIY